MPVIDTTRSLTTWESPEVLSQKATALESAASRFADHVESAVTAWSGFESAYDGPAKDELLDAVRPARASGDFLADASARASASIQDFSSRLASLIRRRENLTAEAFAFNSVHAMTPLHELDHLPQATYLRLNDETALLQAEYENLIAGCVEALKQIRPDRLVEGAVRAERTWRNALVEKSVDGARELFSGIDGPRSLYEHKNFDSVVTLPDGRPNFDAWEQPNTTRTGFSLFGVPFSAGPQGFIHAFKSDRAPHGPLLERFVKEFPDRLTASLANSIPGVSDVKTWIDSNAHKLKTPTATALPLLKTVADDGTVITSKVTTTVREAGLNLRTPAMRLASEAGSVGTLAGAWFEFDGQRDERKQGLAQKEPDMTATEIESEATHDAAANTLGRTAGSILASAGAGAAVGSVVPVAGTAIGLVTGLASGVAMEIKFLPDYDGDGDDDSLADTAGKWIEDRWNDIREVD